MVNGMEQIFPRLRPGAYQVTSPAHPRYNCIAWAAGDTSIWWWPIEENGVFWPTSAPMEESVEAFQSAFATLGYEVCESELEEPGFEKIAIFAESDGMPSHAARQLANGRWTSKFGAMEDIVHDLRDLEGDVYGAVVRIMKRPQARNAGL
jgi:hypothetical protein